MLRILTDRGSEYCVHREHHDYERYLDLEGIDHTCRRPARLLADRGVIPQEILPEAVKRKGLLLEDPMGKQRQSWSIEEKVGIVLAVFSERQSVAEVSRQPGVNENPAYQWKERFLAAGRQGLNGAKAQTADQRLEGENSPLKKLLGEKALEIDILKKPPGFEEGDTGTALPSVSNPTLAESLPAGDGPTVWAAAGLFTG